VCSSDLDPKLMGEAAKILSDYADIIDINFGCCDADILGGKAGAFFIKHPEQIDKVVKSVIDSTSLPVTAKIRIGWDNKSINAVEVSKKLEKLGVAAIAVHARTKTQRFSGKADWSMIKKVKESVSIPVLGNGDVSLPGSAKAMLDQTGCDFVMIGRAAMGNPFIFSRAKYLLENGSNAPEPSRKDVKKCIFEFINFYERQKRQKFSELRDQMLWFVKGLDGARKIKQDIVCIKEKDDLKDYLEKVL
jgi:tRNA-dihydrouridine synthase B